MSTPSSIPGQFDQNTVLPSCAWCRSAPAANRGRFCSRKCRQAAFRVRRRESLGDQDDGPKRLAYADPPYPGLSSKYYRDEPSFAGEVDHAKLIASLMDEYDGWALSTGAYALRDLLPLCPPEARVCAWVKPIGASSRTLGLHSTWEPLIVVQARRRRPGVRDFLIAQPARFGGTLPGRKPLAFWAFLFAALGAAAGDAFADLFPGTGVGSRAWAEVSRSPSASPTHRGGGVAHRSSATSLENFADASPGAAR